MIMHYFLLSAAGEKKKNNQKNTLIGGGDWCETSVFYVFDFQMSAGEEAVSLAQRLFLGERNRRGGRRCGLKLK